MFGFGAAKRREAEQAQKNADDPLAAKPLTSSPCHRSAGLSRRSIVLPVTAKHFTEIPTPGESVHYLMDGRHDMMVAISAIIAGARSKCDILRIATLSLNLRNIDEIVRLADDGNIGSVSIVASNYFSKTDTATYNTCRMKFAERGWRLCAPRCHAKVVCMQFASGNLLTVEGSANLRKNGNFEQVTVINDPGIYAFHAGWIDAALDKYEAASRAAQEK